VAVFVLDYLCLFILSGVEPIGRHLVLLVILKSGAAASNLDGDVGPHIGGLDQQRAVGEDGRAVRLETLVGPSALGRLVV